MSELERMNKTLKWIGIIMLFLVVIVMASSLPKSTVIAEIGQNRHCSPNISCVVGKAVELSGSKWHCIDTILHAVFNKTANNTTSPMTDAKFNAAANTLATEMGLNLCLSSQG